MVFRTIRNTACAAVLATAAMAGLTREAEAAFVLQILEQNGGPNLSGQFTITVSDVGGRVQFEFKNNVGIASSITSIHFDDKITSVLSGTPTLTESAGVDFSVNKKPGNLPGGNRIDFDADVSVSPDGATSPNGINAAGEFLLIAFDYATGANLQTVINQINANPSELVIGFHVQSIPVGTRDVSQSYYSIGYATNVPEPATLALFGAGILGLGLARRRWRS